MKYIVSTLLATSALVLGCATPNTNAIDPGMTRDQIRASLGSPETRSFKGEDEAWQYQGVAGFGQCKYSTVWFSKGLVTAVTSRNGSSIAGCGLGSREVDWGQMPRTTIDININQSTPMK